MKYFLFTFTIFLICCKTKNSKIESNESSLNSEDSISHSLMDLNSIINLNSFVADSGFTPVWQINRMSSENSIIGPNDYYLIAILKVSKFNDTANEIFNTPNIPFKKESIFYRQWLPEPYAKLFSNENNLVIRTFDGKSLARKPYLNGFYLILPENYVYIFMETL